MKGTVNINLLVPGGIYWKIRAISAQEGTTVAELLREMTRIGVFVRAITQDPIARLLIERGGEIQEIVVK